MKRTVSFFLALLLMMGILIVFPVCVQAKTYGDFTYKVASNGDVKILKYNGSEENVIIPSEVDGHIVTELCRDSFALCTMKNVTIPDSVENIRSEAFIRCENLESVSIPDKVKYISREMFSDCRKLKSVRIGKSVEYVREFAFRRCDSLKRISVDAENKYIASKNNSIYSKDMKKLIYYCGNKSKFVVPNSVESIEYAAFEGNQKLKNVYLPDSVTHIGPYAFYKSSLERIRLSENLKTISRSAFCITRLTDVKMPDSVTKMGCYVFSSCYKLKTVRLSDNLRKIPDCTFWLSYNLQNVNIPRNCRKIGGHAFVCSSAEKIIVPKSVVSVGEIAFRGKVREIVFNNPKVRIERFAFYDCPRLKKVKLATGKLKLNVGEKKTWRTLYRSSTFKSLNKKVVKVIYKSTPYYSAIYLKGVKKGTALVSVKEGKFSQKVKVKVI